MSSPSMSEEAVRKATGKGWDEWFALLREIRAEELDHKEIAARLQDDHGVDGWWAQSITVEFERSIGRRDVGQVSDGTYQTAASKTLAGGMDDVLAAWEALIGERQDFDGIEFADEASTSITDMWRYWRVNLADGSKVVVSIGERTADKSLLTVNHEKLADAEAVERWKAYWRELLSELGE